MKSSTGSGGFDGRALRSASPMATALRGRRWRSNPNRTVCSRPVREGWVIGCLGGWIRGHALQAIGVQSDGDGDFAAQPGSGTAPRCSTCFSTATPSGPAISPIAGAGPSKGSNSAGSLSCRCSPRRNAVTGRPTVRVTPEAVAAPEPAPAGAARVEGGFGADRRAAVAGRRGQSDRESRAQPQDRAAASADAVHDERIAVATLFFCSPPSSIPGMLGRSR